MTNTCSINISLKSNYRENIEHLPEYKKYIFLDKYKYINIIVREYKIMNASFFLFPFKFLYLPEFSMKNEREFCSRWLKNDTLLTVARNLSTHKLTLISI